MLITLVNMLIVNLKKNSNITTQLNIGVQIIDNDKEMCY